MRRLNYHSLVPFLTQGDTRRMSDVRIYVVSLPPSLRLLLVLHSRHTDNLSRHLKRVMSFKGSSLSVQKGESIIDLILSRYIFH